ncbi:Mov34/MPN/PAD-1 family protein [Candidatus Woesearchaeota archaeon]|nr:Mov34/MPN/PAD-1 family protein [Candidatus Woesearchaeota archaeon]
MTKNVGGGMIMKNKLEELLANTSAEVECEHPVSVREHPVEKVYVTKSALAKANAYASLACEVLKESVECYGYLITPKGENDRIVRDVYLAPGQDVGSAHVIIPGSNVIMAGRAIDALGYRVLGWWHSHANMETFHSKIDDDNMRTVLNSVGATNFVRIYRQVSLLSGQLGVRRKNAGVEVYEVGNSRKRVRLVLGSKDFKIEDLGGVKSIVVDMAVNVGFAYSVVVNAKGDNPFCVVATDDFCELCHGSKEESVESELVVVNQVDFRIDKKRIVNEIKERIKKPKKIRVSKRRYSPLTGMFDSSAKIRPGFQDILNFYLSDGAQEDEGIQE